MYDPLAMADELATSLPLRGAATIAFAALLSVLLIVLLRPLLVRYALARPNARSSHTIPTPQGGGIAVIVAVFVAVLLATAFSVAEPPATAALWPVAAAVALLAVTGALADILHLPVLYRLPLQLIAVGIVLTALPTEARVIPLLPWWLERAALLIGGVYFVNLVNFMDGIDWMTVAEVVPVTAALALLTLTGALAPSSAAAIAPSRGDSAPTSDSATSAPVTGTTSATVIQSMPSMKFTRLTK